MTPAQPQGRKMTEELDDDDPIEAEPTEQRLAAVERRLALDQIERDLNIPSDLAEKVYKVAKDSKLSVMEAAAVLAQRDPAAFGQAGAASPQFASLSPRLAAPRARPDDAKLRKAYIESLRGKDERTRDRMLENQIGGHLADALGWHHELIRLPL